MSILDLNIYTKHKTNHFIWEQTGSCFLVAGAEVAVLCITKSGEVLNYQAFTNSNGIYTVAETMPESDRWDACLARPISSFHEHCAQLGDGSSGVKFTYNHQSGYSHTVKPFVYRPAILPTYCIWWVPFPLAMALAGGWLWENASRGNQLRIFVLWWKL